MNKNKINVAVIFGGKSNEHEVSIRSGELVVKNLNHLRYNVKPIFISPNGNWHIPRNFLSDNRAFSAQEWIKSADKAPSLITKISQNIDIAFLALHGGYGENGCIQGFFELIGLRYLGSGVLASALAFDKIMAKQIYLKNNIPTPEYLSLVRNDWRNKKETLNTILKKFGLPCVVKASQSGSSRDMGIPKSKKYLESLLDAIFKNCNNILVEEWISGMEFSCGVIEEKNNIIALPPTQIIPKTSAFFDYKAKYTKGASEEITPAKVPDKMISRIQKLSIAAHTSLGCKGYSRTDILYKNGKYFVLETNTLPGLTQTSLFPQQAFAVGIAYGDLLDKLILNELEN